MSTPKLIWQESLQNIVCLPRKKLRKSPKQRNSRVPNGETLNEHSQCSQEKGMIIFHGETVSTDWKHLLTTPSVVNSKKSVKGQECKVAKE
ncbi:hypothetical protein POVCU2_0001400 [Plasmodium ovale curtisi]|uniref:Uncharacterized protein n=1 Tax=Plasmodium ovale curtisi TaxID=864141 RepID=A0A1A8VMI3_PLAOA|nr:hypothetical protein POVCU2_0001400 [Plasmodium ovale curtisi]